MATVFERIKEIYSMNQTSCRYSTISLRMFVEPERPHDSRVVLKGKAAEVKDLVLPLLQIWRDNMDGTCLAHKQIEMLLSRSARAEQILEERRDDFVLRGAPYQEFRDNIEQYLLLLSALGRWHADRGQNLFTTTVKAHYMAHVAEAARHLSPRRSWCDCRWLCLASATFL